MSKKINYFSRHAIEEATRALKHRKTCRVGMSNSAMTLLSRYGGFSRSEIESGIRKAFKRFSTSRSWMSIHPSRKTNHPEIH